MTDKQKNTIVTKAPYFMILCSVVLYLMPLIRANDLANIEADDLVEISVLNVRNATDTLILLIELATESSGDYVRAKTDHIEMLNKYIKHMKNRNRPWLFENDIAEELKLVIKKLKEDEKEVDRQMEACEKIEIASKTIAKFLNKHKLFINEPIVSPKPEVISEEMQTTIKDLLNEAHKKTQAYINDLNMINSEIAYRANRKVIVYLYLIRSQWSEIITSEERINLAGDINRTIHWNQVLKKRSDVTEEERSRLTMCSANEFRHLRILRAIIDNDVREAHGWLKLAIKKAFPNDDFFAKE